MSETSAEIPNTEEQERLHAEQEARWAEESSWPLWQVEISGDEVEWVARPGVNEDENGVPQPWNAPAVATVTLLAKNEDHAKALALNANPSYHTVNSVTELEK